MADTNSKLLFKGIKLVDGTKDGFSVASLEDDILYFVRTTAKGIEKPYSEEGYLYINGKKYGNVEKLRSELNLAKEEISAIEAKIEAMDFDGIEGDYVKQVVQEDGTIAATAGTFEDLTITVLGADGDTANTVYDTQSAATITVAGKDYVDDYVANAIADLYASKSGTTADGYITVQVDEEDGLLCGVTVTDKVVSMTDADTDNKGLAEASDVKAYVDAATAGSYAAGQGIAFTKDEEDENKTIISADVNNAATNGVKVDIVDGKIKAGVETWGNVDARKTNVATGAEVISHVANEIKQLDVDGYVQATVGENAIIISGIKEDDGKIAADSTKNVTIDVDGTVSSTNKLATQNTVKTAIEALDVTDAAVAGKVVKSVSEEDGKISVSHDYLADTDIQLVKKETAGEGLASEYYLVNGNNVQLGATIQIAKDQFLKEVHFYKAQSDVPAGVTIPTGTEFPVIRFIFTTTAGDTESWVSVKDLVDTYTADESTITLSGNNVFSVKDNGITTTKIADLNVTTAKIADSGITTDKLAADAVTNAKLADNAVQTENVKDGAITNEKLAAVVTAITGTSTAITTEGAVKNYVDQQVGTAVQSVSGDTYVVAETDDDNNVTLTTTIGIIASATAATDGLATAYDVKQTIEGLNVDSVGGAKAYIQSISEENGKISPVSAGTTTVGVSYYSDGKAKDTGKIEVFSQTGINSTDRVATVSYVNGELGLKISELNSTATTEDNQLVKVTVIQENGILTSASLDDSALDTALAGKVATGTTIANVDLANDITKAELLTALNVEDGAQVNDIETVIVNGVTGTTDATAKTATVTIDGTNIKVGGTGDTKDVTIEAEIADILSQISASTLTAGDSIDIDENNKINVVAKDASINVNEDGVQVQYDNSVRNGSQTAGSESLIQGRTTTNGIVFEMYYEEEA